jgi:3-hydroxy-5-methyl-1-naphthoate 3-O-methyltransferase
MNASIRRHDRTKPPETDPTALYRYRDRLNAAFLLSVALAKFDIVSYLKEVPSSAAQIAAHFGFAERPCDVMLTLCAATGIIEKLDEVFHITKLAQEHVGADSPWNMTPYLAPLTEHPMAQDFIKILRTDKPAGTDDQSGVDWHQAMEESEEFATAFTAQMDSRGRFLGQALATKLDLSDKTHLLDIGGASGIYSCCLVAHFPNLRATVVDQPPVDGVARRCIAERGYEDRVTVFTANMFKDPLPMGCDVHLFSNVLHDWAVPEIRELLAISYRALPVRGIVVVHDAFMNDEKNGPLPVAEYSTLLLHATQGKCYSIAEYSAFLREAGFVPGTYKDTGLDRGFMVARKG